MKFYTSAAIFGLAFASDSCKYSLEIVQLQDGSDSFRDDLVNMQTVAGDLFSTLATTYPGMRFGLSSFVDKPLPGRGYGAWGGWQMTDAVHDYCYAANLPLTTDPNAYSKAISDFTVGSGFDFQENQLEGLVRLALDTKTGFTPPNVDYDIDGRPIVRIAIMITDATPHKAGDAEGCTKWYWNFGRDYNYYGNGTSNGGFGADDFFDMSGIFNYFTPEVRADYEEACSYFRIHDVEQRAFTDSEAARLNELLANVGPYPWPEILPFPGDDSLPCEATEYPTPQQAGAVLREKKIIPVILLAQADAGAIWSECDKAGLPTDDPASCMQTIYHQILDEMGVGGVIGQLGDASANVVEAIVAAIEQVTDEICITTPTPTNAPDADTTTPAADVDITTHANGFNTKTHANGFNTKTHANGFDTKTHANGFNTKTHANGFNTKTHANGFDTKTHANGFNTKTHANGFGTTVAPAPPNPSDDTTSPHFPTRPSPPLPPHFPTAGVITLPPTDAPVPPTDAPVPPTDAPVPPTDAPVPPTDAPVPPTDAPVPPTDAPVPPTSTDSTTTGNNVIPPPAPAPVPSGGGSSSTGVVVGAAAGGAAVLGAAAFAAAKMGLMGGAKATADLEAIQQVEVPESPLEREAMEEVTMEMFQ